VAGTNDKTEGARGEFLAEAQELIEAMSRDLLILDHAQQKGSSEPDVLNDLFRGVHTLKGLAGMFGLSQLGQLAHLLEDLLEDLRLGKKNLTRDVLDILFEGIDGFQRMLAEAKNPAQAAKIDVERFGQSIRSLSSKKPPAADVLDQYELDPAMLGVLTEYETHRLRTNLEQGITVYRLFLRLSLDVIDTALKELKERGKKFAEIITYLPSMSSGPDDMIDIDVLLASRASEAELREKLNQPDAALSLIRSKTGQTPQAQAPVESKRPVEKKSFVPDKRVSITAGAPKTEKGAATSPDMSAAALSLRSTMNTVRVDITKLDQLMNSVGELGIVRSSLGRVLESIRSRPDLRKLTGEMRRIHRSFERCLSEVQGNVLDVRMVPLSHLFNKVARVVRQVARDNAKEVRMVVTGSDTEVDKLIAEELADPLMHMVRNSIDHGIEPPGERERIGKPPAGILTINAYQKGNHVVIEVQDDGRGIDPKKIMHAAISREILSEQVLSEMSRDDLLNAIFLPGLSTAEKVTEISGRGVGMDVVKTNLTRLGGSVQVESELGKGTKFIATLPITLAIISALVVEVAGRTMAIPLASIQEAIKYNLYSTRKVEGREVLTLRGSTLPICRLADRFGFAPRDGNDKQFVVVVLHGNRRIGFTVDRLRGQQDIVIKSLGPSLRGIRGVTGATDLGDQKLVLVLDAPALLDDFLRDSDVRSLVGVAP
jgi:two-component system chemotaxis sensor kinase CheA